MAENTNDIVDELELDDVVSSVESSGFSGAKIGRFVAVALFLLLGTFAVIHSMTRARAPHADHNHGENIGSSLTEAGKQVADKTSAAIGSLKDTTNAAIDGVAGNGVTGNGIAGKYGSIVAAGRNAANKFATAAPASSKFPSTSFPKPGGSVAKPAGKAPTSGFAAKSPAIPAPKQYQASSLPKTLRNRTPEPPPQRFAAIPGKPLIGSQGGFGEIKKPLPPSAVNSRFAAPKATQQTAATANSLIRKSGSEAQQLLGNLAKAPEVVRSKAAGFADSASSSINSVAGQARQTFGNVTQATTQSARDLSNRPFGAPAIKPSNNRFAAPQSPNASQPSSPFAALPKANAVPKPSSTSSSASRFPSNLRASTSPRQPKSAPGVTAVQASTSSSSARRTLASTVARPVVATPQSAFPPSRPTTPPPARPATSPAKSSFGSYTGSRTQAGPAARVAAAVTMDVPGDRRLDGLQAPSLSIEKAFTSRNPSRRTS